MLAKVIEIKLKNGRKNGVSRRLLRTKPFHMTYDHMLHLSELNTTIKSELHRHSVATSRHTGRKRGKCLGEEQKSSLNSRGVHQANILVATSLITQNLKYPDQ